MRVGINLRAAAAGADDDWLRYLDCLAGPLARLGVELGFFAAEGQERIIPDLPSARVWMADAGERRDIGSAARREIDLLWGAPPLDPPFIDLPVVVTVPALTAVASREMALAVARSQAIATFSDCSSRKIVQAFPQARDRVFRTGLAAPPPVAGVSHATDTDLDGIRERYALPPRYLLSPVDRAGPVELDLLLRAVAGLRARQGDVALALWGESDALRGGMEAFVNPHGLGEGVRWVGKGDPSHLPALCRGAVGIVCITPLDLDQLRTTEMMAAGCALAAPDDEATEEIAGDATLRYPHADSAALAAVLERLVLDPELRGALAEGSAERARRHTWDQAATEMLGVFEHALRGDSPDRHYLPLVSVVTPSLNQGEYLKATIESVARQDYPRIEHLVRDGGSTDSTLRVLREVGDRVVWTSRPDRGQADAVNQGVGASTGEIIGWLNSDDVYYPGAVAAAVEAFLLGPELDVVYGDAECIGPSGERLSAYPTEDFDWDRLARTCFICQPAAFIRRAAWERVGGLNTALQCSMDYELWLRLGASGSRFGRHPHLSAGSRIHPGAKTLRLRRLVHEESLWAVQQHARRLPREWLLGLAELCLNGSDGCFQPPTPPDDARDLAEMLEFAWEVEGVPDLWQIAVCFREALKRRSGGVLEDSSTAPGERVEMGMESRVAVLAGSGADAAAAWNGKSERPAPDSAPLRAAHEELVGRKRVGYRQVVSRIREIVRETLAPDATVVVVSRGDPELLRLGSRQAWHFPRDPDGGYVGYHPENSASAIEHLEALRAKGGDHLLFPSTSFWWLRHYREFREYLERHYRTVAYEEGVCLLLSASERVVALPGIPIVDLRRAATGLPGAVGSGGDARAEIAEQLLAAGQEEEAYTLLTEGLRADPRSVRLLALAVRCESARGSIESAERYAAEALSLEPDDRRTGVAVARLHLQQGRNAAAYQRLARLAALYPSDPEVVSELARSLCRLLHQSGAAGEPRLVVALRSLIDDPRSREQIAPETLLSAADLLARLGHVSPASSSLVAALRELDPDSGAVRDFTSDLLRPALRSSVPFDNPRELSDLLIHTGNGYLALRDRFRALACYHLASAAHASSPAANLNLAFAAIADGDPMAAMDRLAKVSRVYAGDAGMVAWPSWNGRAWPYHPFPLRAPAEKLKPQGVEWPRITVITPSFNQADFVEETLLSVLNQEYPELEYIVVDGGSTDGSQEVLRSYETRLTRLVIEPDRGQTDALNKALRIATGELILWVNSDDMLAPGALFMLALTYLDEDADLIAGFCCEHMDHRFSLINLPGATSSTFNAECLGNLFGYWLKGHYFYQPEVAFTRRILERVGGALDDSLYFTMDYEFWMRCVRAGGQLAVIHWPVGLFRKHPNQKTSAMDRCVIEQGRVRDRFVVPRPSFERKLEIGRRLRRVFEQPVPTISIVSTRAPKIFSPDTARELSETFAARGLRVTFSHDFEALEPRETDLLLVLVHLHEEQQALHQLRQSGHAGPIVGWFWDNHHHVFANHKIAEYLDIGIAGHAFAADYLRSRNLLLDAPVPLCVTQWSTAEATRFFGEYGRLERSDALYGGFVRYPFAERRNRLIEELIADGTEGVYFLEEGALEPYFGLPLAERFRRWASHKASVCLPLDGDLSQRLFDALLTGQIPLVPADIHDLDRVIPRDVQEALPIIRFDHYVTSAVASAHAEAIRRFAEDPEGVARRHRFALSSHSMVSRVDSIVSRMRELALTA